MSVRLTTPRLVLRPPVLADAQALVAALDHRSVLRETESWAYPSGAGVFRARIEGFARQDPRHDATFAICRSGVPVGLIGLHRRKRRVFGLGYMLSPRYAGRGLVTEAAGAVCAYGFERMKAEAIVANVFTDNLASRRVLEKTGFDFRGEVAPGWSATRRANFPRVEYALERAQKAACYKASERSA
ncbi:GNAT family N-acetyltransferase [Parvularcula dongshanensis]|uniref:RimJ/RimL family protein N-acetyltransferase n=1 Tax=Parvularcula dongshanensis TaxID=1173995 RepID=A0A840I3G3_9PROT|nr:RimJ/RimL family protein N-acetyltransferase [Parvularcula dongshanensis]